MPVSAVLSYAAAYFSLIVAAAVLLRDWRSTAHRLFAVGLALFMAEECLRGFIYGVVLPEDVSHWYKRLLVISALIPGVWMAFSLAYARVNSSEFLSKWKWLLITTAIAPAGFALIARSWLLTGTVILAGAGRWNLSIGWAGRTLDVVKLVMAILILFNLERTVRSSRGRMRWQIKFMALGVGGLFALRIFLISQTLLYNRIDAGLGPVYAVALLAANLMFAASLARGRSLNVDVYLSTATIHNSLTIVLSGVYLLVVGLLAFLARHTGFSSSLPVDAFVVFLSLTGLAVLLLSDRIRRKLRLFVSTHFNRPLYDYRNVWMELTQRTTSLLDARELSNAVSRMVSESLDVLSVSVWLVDESQRRLTLAGSTAFSGHHSKEMEKAGKSASELISFLKIQPGMIDFDRQDFAWRSEIESVASEFFRQHRMRYAIGLQAAGELVGVMTLNEDRVGQEKTLTDEDLMLLETFVAQLAAGLLNLRLSARLRHAKEVETFQTVSTFFVHDLKNLASRLSLTMQNLPANFDNPEFRADALRVMANSVNKIDDMCARLGMLKQNIELNLGPCDLNALVCSTLEEFGGNLRADLTRDLKPVPSTVADEEQIHKVLTNLILNANEAVNGHGSIHVATLHEGNSVGFVVRDNGCGMSEEFMEKSLFKPFQTTKKKGLGIGLFHSKLIVEAHHGSFEVTSAVGAGTEFRVVLPIG